MTNQDAPQRRQRSRNTIYTAFYNPDLREHLQQFATDNDLVIQEYQGMMDLWTEPGIVAVIDREYFGPDDWKEMVELMGTFERPPFILLDDRHDLPLPDHWEVYRIPMADSKNQITKTIHRIHQEQERHIAQREAVYHEIEALLGRGHYFHTSFVKDGPVDRHTFERQDLKLLWIMDSMPDPRANASDLREYIREVLPHQLETNTVTNDIWNRVLQVTLGILDTHLRQDPTDPVVYEEAVSLAQQEMTEFNCISLRKVAIVNADKTGTGKSSPEMFNQHVQDFTKLTYLQLVNYQPDIILCGPAVQPVIDAYVPHDASYTNENHSSSDQIWYNENQLICQVGAPDSTPISQEEYYNRILTKVTEYLEEYRW